MLEQKLRPLFRGRRLEAGDRIRIGVAAPGTRGKLFTLRVRRNGRALPAVRYTGPAGEPAQLLAQVERLWGIPAEQAHDLRAPGIRDQ